MVRKTELLLRVRNNPKNVRFSDLVTLVEDAGFVLVRQRGTSHRRYLHLETGTYLNLQPDTNGMAKRYQVTQAIEAIDSVGLTVGKDEA